jgi:hypothetical protein
MAWRGKGCSGFPAVSASLAAAAWKLLPIPGKGAATAFKGGNMLWTIIAILFALWLLGLIAHVGGGLIHLLLVVALVIFVVNLLTGRRTVV